MSYIEFLGQWYNVVFLLLGILGVATWLAGRLRGARKPLLAGTLIGSAVAGLTINGAVHDLALGDPGAGFPLVLGASVITAWALAWGYQRLARRYFPPVEGVEIDSPNLTGMEARVVSKEIGREPRSGRAQRQSGDTLHLVHCHTSGEGIGFGSTVRLVEYDPRLGSYRIERAP